MVVDTHRHSGPEVPPRALDLMDRMAAMAEAAIREGWQGDLQVESKQDPADLVTRVDREVEARARAMVAETLPDHAFLGEEGGGEPSAHGWLWVVDPVDGTANYANALPHACVSIGVLRDGAPVAGLIADPFRGERFRGVPGAARQGSGRPLRVSGRPSLASGLVLLEMGGRTEVAPAMLALFSRVRAEGGVCRVLGSAALSLAYVAAGRAEACLFARASAWDVAAGVQLVRAAGGLVTSWDGEPYDVLRAGPLLAGSAAGVASIGDMLRG